MSIVVAITNTSFSRLPFNTSGQSFKVRFSPSVAILGVPLAKPTVMSVEIKVFMLI